MLTLQRLIAELSAFWEGEGCLIEQPYDLPMGAGTMHPATFLRVLGPDPWRCAYVQPSRRPADGRYGREPLPARQAPPAPGRPEALARGRPGDLPAQPRAARDRARGARRPLRGRQLGVPDAGRLGSGLAGRDGRHGDHPVHVLPAGRRHRPRAGHRRDHLRPRADRDVPVQGELHLRRACGTTRSLRPGPPARGGTSSSKYFFEVADPDLAALLLDRLRGGGAARRWPRASSSPPTRRRSPAPTSSTSSTRGAPCPRPTASA